MAFLHVSEVLLAGAGSLRVEAGAVWVKMAVVEKWQGWRLENSVSCGLHVSGLHRSVDQGVYVDLGWARIPQILAVLVWVKQLLKFVYNRH